jgi:type IV secretory pathway component VirB8
MNPLFTLLIKQLPRWLPVVKAMMERPSRATTEEGRLAIVEQSVEWLAERSDALEKKLRRLTLLVAVVLILSLVAFIIALSR